MAEQQPHREAKIPSDPLLDHPTTPRIGKRKTRCIKTSDKDYTIKFGEGLTVGEVADKAGKVLVGRVRGRTYTREFLGLWVKEIWGKTFIHLLEVQLLPRGWLVLHFTLE